MKKILIGMLSIAMMLTLAACAWEEEDPLTDNIPDNTDQPSIADEDNTPSDQPLKDEPVADDPAIDDPEAVEREAVMELVPAELSPAEEQMASLIQGSYSCGIYDFTVDDTLQKITAYAYELGEDGTWHRISGAGTLFSEPQGRLAISFDLIGERFTLSTQGENETNKATHSRDSYMDLEEELAEDGMMTITEQLRSTFDIVYGEEIPVAIQGMSSNHEAASLSLSDYYNIPALLDAGYQQAYALTLTFSDQK